MATKIKTTVTFTFSFLSDNKDRAISSLRSWLGENTDKDVKIVRDSDTDEYTYLDTSTSVGCTFKFSTPAEFIEKYSRTEGVYAPVRAMLDYTQRDNVTVGVETIEVEEGK